MKNNDTHLAEGTILHSSKFSYQILKVLGQGSFGITYLADVIIDGHLGSIHGNMQVCVKEFFMRDVNGRKSSTVTSGSKGGVVDYYREKFRREAQNLASLKHPNIVKVLESFDANGTSYYVMEFIQGQNLDDYINQHGRLSEATATNILRQVGSAVAFMHSHKMLHLDIKPKNIMIDHSGKAVLIDFGLSKQYDEQGEPESSTKVGAGTPGYAPIEQASYHEGHGFPTAMDVYALGGTMFKMLSGERPPEASEILNDGFPATDLSKRKVSPAMIAFVRKAMSPVKHNRFQTVDEMLAAHPSAGSDDENTTFSNEPTFAIVEDEPVKPQPKPVQEQVNHEQPDNNEIPEVSEKPKKKKSKGIGLGVLSGIFAVVIGNVIRCNHRMKEIDAQHARTSMNYDYTSSPESDSATYDASADLNKAEESTESVDETLQQAAFEANKEVPQTVDEYTICVGVTFSEGHFTYTYKVTGISCSDVDKGIMKSELRKDVTSNMKPLCKMLGENGYDLRFEYTDESGGQLTVKFTPSELLKISK